MGWHVHAQISLRAEQGQEKTNESTDQSAGHKNKAFGLTVEGIGEVEKSTGWRYAQHSLGVKKEANMNS